MIPFIISDDAVKQESMRTQFKKVSPEYQCCCKSPILKDAWGDDTLTQCFLKKSHDGPHCGYDGANGYISWS